MADLKEIMLDFFQRSISERAKATQFGPEIGEDDEHPLPNVQTEITEFLPNQFALQSEVVEEKRGVEAIEIECPDDTGTVGVDYDSEFTVTGGTEPYSFEITSGDLPDGLDLDPDTGAISGTPTTEGEFDFTVTVTDDEGNTSEADCSITIEIGGPECTCYDFRPPVGPPPPGFVGSGLLLSEYPLIDGRAWHWNACARYVEFDADLSDIDPLNWTIDNRRTWELTSVDFGSEAFIQCSFIEVQNPNELFGWWFEISATALDEIRTAYFTATGLEIPVTTHWRIWFNMTGGFDYDAAPPHRRIYETDETLSSPVVVGICWG